MIRHSALYCGWVQHLRLDGPQRRFRMPLCMVYLDLAEIPQTLERHPWWRIGRPAPYRFCRRDYLGPAQLPLAQAVRQRVEAQGAPLPEGPVRMLTLLRGFGCCFNPVTFYYCFDQGERLQAVLAEITNTPWLQRHCYVIRPDAQQRLRARFPKQFHVSPFFPMQQEYCWHFPLPGRRLAVHMRNLEADRCVFSADLVLQRRPWNAFQLTRACLRYPGMSLQALAAIYLHAARLWQRGARFFPHPARHQAARPERSAA